MCLKISRCGGLQGLLETARRARAVGYEVFLASTLDGPLGIAAALHAAALLHPARASGLATLSVSSPRVPIRSPRSAGRIALPAGPGLGDGLTDWYRARALRRPPGQPSRSAPRPPPPGPRGGRRARPRARPRAAPSGRPAAIRSAIARNFSSRSPTTSVTGSVELAEPVPQRRQRPGPEAAQRRGQPGGRAAQPVGVDLGGHVGGQPGQHRVSAPSAGRTPRACSASISSASARVGGPALRAARRRRPAPGWRRSGPAGGPARVRRAPACRAIRPPIEYPPSTSRRRAQRPQSRSGPCRSTGRCVARRAPWPAEVGGERAVAFAERGGHAAPARTGVREAVEQHQVVGHPPDHDPSRIPICCCARSADELARSGVRHACTSPGSRSTPLVLALVREPRPAGHVAHRRAQRRLLRPRRWPRPAAGRWCSPAPREPRPPTTPRR